VNVTENNKPSSVDPSPSHLPSNGEAGADVGEGLTVTGFEMQDESKNIETIKTNKI
jgi:hypothetical protein